jgi:hypothetical protein
MTSQFLPTFVVSMNYMHSVQETNISRDRHIFQSVRPSFHIFHLGSPRQISIKSDAYFVQLEAKINK